MRRFLSLHRLAPLGVLMVTTVAAAQESLPNYPPPTPKTADPPAVWISYLIMAVLVGAVLGISLTPAKRGHQD
jgi:hypothetical protein